MRHDIGLFTDLYELTMAQAYLDEQMHDSAVFSLFVRRLPPARNVLVACGLAPVLRFLEQVRFSDTDLDYLRSLDRFSDELLDWLRGFRFRGDVYAVAEGTPLFANEPILEVVAPIAEAQLVETFVMNQIHHQTVLATKAARIVAAARGRKVVDFGARRTHGVDAAVEGARAAYIGGIHSTSNVLAGKRYGIPVAGTMAHSYIQAHDDERAALQAFARTFPGTVLLVDTYDTLEGVRRAIDVAGASLPSHRITALRLDSGDIGPLAAETRRLLDANGLRDVGIFASSGLDEHAIARLLAAGAPIDGFGVGTALGVSSDAPALDIAYKLTEYAGRGRTKLSSGKPVLPGRKQVFRREENGCAVEDIVAQSGEWFDGRPLLQPVMRSGRIVGSHEDLDAARKRAAAQLRALPERVGALTPEEPLYPVRLSDALDRAWGDIQQRTAPSDTSRRRA